MAVNIPDRFLPQIVIALAHHGAYLNATKRDGRPFEEIVQKLQRKAKEHSKRRIAPTGVAIFALFDFAEVVKTPTAYRLSSRTLFLSVEVSRSGAEPNPKTPISKFN